MKRTAATMLAAFYLCLITGSLVCNVDYGTFFLYKLVGTGSIKESAKALDRSVSDPENEPATDRACTYLSCQEVLRPVLADNAGLAAVVSSPVTSWQIRTAPIVPKVRRYPDLIYPDDPVPRYLRIRTLLI
ncbi:hypothetical protein [Mucilaginibacter defluvii]|uniref:Uncharacterized protein n=1 Tax=Mucilaginibacter defluvii TaxID=1196019 RepID=A0ABP9FS01_9SPHI